MTKRKHFAAHFSRAHCSHRACSSLLEPNCRKGLVAHQRKAWSGKAFRPQDHTLAVPTCYQHGQFVTYLLSPVFIWQSVWFSLNGTGATQVDLLAPSSWSPPSSPSPHPCSHKRSRKEPKQPNKNTWERERQGDSYWWNILAPWLPGTGICSSQWPSLNAAAWADIQWDFALWLFQCFSLSFGWLLNVFASPIFVSSV